MLQQISRKGENGHIQSCSKLIVQCLNADIVHKLNTAYFVQGGAYIFQLMDFYSASGMCLLWVCFFQTIAISWIFGADKFIECVHQMMGVRPNRFWYFCWVFFAPATMVVSVMHFYWYIIIISDPIYVLTFFLTCP